ncbi:MAG: MATE family efflux transporter [Lachnospiraceae bacterium]|nr:MATE family efflux transporter [Lachnospiraceae bacterium]
MRKESEAKAVNLGEGSIGKLMWKLALPTIIAQMVNLLYNLIDRIYIGHIPGTGDIALTGLGLCFPIIMLITAFSSLIGFGGAPRVAIFMGKGDMKTAEKIVGNCVAALVFLSIILTVVLELTGTPILKLFGASENTLPYALSYLRIYVFGTLFVMVAVGLNPFITTQGFTRESMKMVVIGAVCNIILDPIFIFLFHMGVQGAALATIISQAISAFFILRFLLSDKSKIKILKQNLRIQPAIILPVMALGISPFVMSATESLLNVAFNSSLAKYGGDEAVGAMTILSSIMQLQMLPVQGLTQGAQPIISFNYGAMKVERVKKAFRLLILVCVIYTTIFWLAVQLAPELFVKIFNNNSPELIATTAWAIRIYFAVSFTFGILVSVQQTFMALGQAKISLLIACLRKVILLIPLIYILPNFLENKTFAVFLAEPVADFLSISVALILFITNINKILSKAGDVK